MLQCSCVFLQTHIALLQEEPTLQCRLAARVPSWLKVLSLCAGIFSRACTALCGQKGNREAVLAEATALKDSLVDKLASLRSSQGGNSQGQGIGHHYFSLYTRCAHASPFSLYTCLALLPLHLPCPSPSTLAVHMHWPSVLVLVLGRCYINL